MSQWKGLHNPERHERVWVNVACATCSPNPATAANVVWCDRDDPCRCCLAAEVETLRADVESLSGIAGAALAARNTAEAQVEALRADVKRALSMLDSAVKLERNMGDYLTLTQISTFLRGALGGAS